MGYSILLLTAITMMLGVTGMLFNEGSSIMVQYT